MPETKLKPCPFCGSEKVFSRFEYRDFKFNTLLVALKIRCLNCEAEKKKFFEICDTSFEDIAKAMGEAVEAWNRRAENETD